MFGWLSRASRLPSRLNRSSPRDGLAPINDRLSSLMAARPSNRPSARSASQTLPIPPWPMGATSR